MYFDFFVNGVMLVMFLIFLYLWKGDTGRLKELAKNVKVRRVFTISLWILLVIGLFLSAFFYDALDRGHDINDAMEAGSRHFLDGGNPYIDEVVPRFSERYNGPDTVMMNDTYNYLPGSLLLYTGSFVITGGLGHIWFPLTNLLLGLATVLVAWRTFRKIPLLVLFPAISIVSLFFMFDNIMLTMLFISISIYFLVRSQHRYRIFLALFFLFLGAFVKVIGILALVVLFLYLIQRYRFKDSLINKQMVLLVIVTVSISLLLILPFGFGNVSDSTVFYFSDVESRTSSSGYGGTVLTNILRDSPIFSTVSNLLMLTLLAGCLFIKDPLKRAFTAESLLVLITIKASQAILVIPFYLLFTMIALFLLDEEITSFPEPDDENVEDRSYPSK